LSTSRSRTASSITQWTRVRACSIRLPTSVALPRTCGVTAGLSPCPPPSRNCAYLPASSGYRVVMDVLTTDTFPANALVDVTLTGRLSARESASRGQGTFVECTDQP
jgi:hypothetical protein